MHPIFVTKPRVHKGTKTRITHLILCPATKVTEHNSTFIYSSILCYKYPSLTCGDRLVTFKTKATNIAEGTYFPTVQFCTMGMRAVFNQRYSRVLRNSRQQIHVGRMPPH